MVLIKDTNKMSCFKVKMILRNTFKNVFLKKYLQVYYPSDILIRTSKRSTVWNHRE